MMRENIVTVSAVVLGLGLLGYIVFFAPKAPEVNFGAVEVPGTVFTEYSETSEGVITVKGEMGAPGFVTVHKSIGGAPGAIIGQSGYLENGPFMASMVAQEKVMPGDTYIILAYKDDGDASLQVDPDMPIKVDGKVVRGEVIAKTFSDEPAAE